MIGNVQQDNLFGYCVSMGNKNASHKDTWDKRAEEVMNEIVTEESFTYWLQDHNDSSIFGEYAGILAEKYFKGN